MSQAILQGSRLVVAIVLARLLTPTEYGIAAMVLVFSSFVLPLADLGLSSAVVQRRSLTSRDTSTVFWTSVAAGALFTVLGVALSGSIAEFYGESEVKPLFITLSLTFVIVSLATVHRALLWRDINFKVLELRLLAATFVAAVLAIAIAAAGYGAWALVVQFVAGVTVSTVLLWFTSPFRPRFTFSMASLRQLGPFGVKTVGARLLTSAKENSDQLLIGRFLGAASLGVYTIAYTIILVPFSRIVAPLQEIAFPALSHLQDDRPTVAAAWIRGNRLLASVTVPPMLALVVIAPDFVPVVLGERWEPAVPIIQILSVVGLVQVLQGMNASVLQALDRAGSVVWFSALSFVAGIIGVVVGLNWGITGVAVGNAVAATASLPVYTWLTVRPLGLVLKDVARSLSGVAQASAAMFLVLVIGRAVLLQLGLPAGLRLPIECVIAVAAYVPFCAWRAPEVVAEIRGLRSRRATGATALDAAESVPGLAGS